MMVKNKWIVYLCLGTMLLAAGCGNKEAAVENSPVVKSEKVKVHDDNSSAVYSGAVKGRYESKLSFQVGGRVIARNVEVGSQVSAGQVLLTLDSRDVVQGVNSGSAQVESARAQLNLAASNAERYRQLYEQNAVSAAVYDQYRTTYESAAAALRQAEAQLSQSSNSLGYTNLVALSSGVISSLSAETGQVVAAGQTVAELVQDGEREIEINVPENKVDEMRQQPGVTVTFWALDGLQLEGTIREISPIADSVTRTYTVRITLLDVPDTVKLGMTAKVKLGGIAQGNVDVPLSAIHQTGNTPCVWVISDGKVSLRQVSVTSFGDNRVVIGSGLKNGERIVTAGVQKLQEGQQVRLMDGEQE